MQAKRIDALQEEEDRRTAEQVQAFEWEGRQYFYSPGHHKIFSNPDIPPIPPTAPKQVAPGEVGIRSMYLNISEGCNLNCAYCFIPPPKPGHSTKMSEDTARAAIIKLANWWQEQPFRRTASITFFGGEPLLNRSVLEYAIHFSREWGREFGIPFSYAVSTNATILKEEDLQLFQRESVFLWISIDGPADVHDRNRPFRSGKGSHAIVMDKALKALDWLGPGRVGIRATISTHSEELSKTIHYFASQGFRRLSTKPVDPNQVEKVSLQENGLKKLSENVDECVSVLQFWKHQGLKCFPVDQDLESLQNGPFGKFVCAAGSGSLTVDANGWVYPCHRFIGNQAYNLGHVREKIRLDRCQEFADLDVSRLPVCNQCWARKFCLGCCPGASVAAGNPLGYPNIQTCKERMLYALVSLKCAVSEGMYN